MPAVPTTSDEEDDAASPPEDDDDDESSNSHVPPSHDSDNDTDIEDDTKAATTKAKQKNRSYTYEVQTKKQPKQTVARTDVDYEEPAPTVAKDRLRPNAIWGNIDESMKQVRVEKTAVHEFVANSLFPKLKFLRGSNVQMDYSIEKRSICCMVMEGCNQEHSPAGMMWWAIARKQTMTEIKRLRNDASKNLKVAFMGKSGDHQIGS